MRYSSGLGTSKNVGAGAARRLAFFWTRIFKQRIQSVLLPIFSMKKEKSKIFDNKFIVLKVRGF